MSSIKLDTVIVVIDLSLQALLYKQFTASGLILPSKIAFSRKISSLKFTAVLKFIAGDNVFMLGNRISFCIREQKLDNTLRKGR